VAFVWTVTPQSRVSVFCGVSVALTAFVALTYTGNKKFKEEVIVDFSLSPLFIGHGPHIEHSAR
jgi:hypothetical protein